MAWDTSKNVGDVLTNTEWNAHVTDQKARVLKAGDTITSTLIIDPDTDVPALKIIPQNDTATTKFSIQVRDAANSINKFTVDNDGNIVTVGTVDGVDISTWRNAVSGVAALSVTREVPHHINKAASANARNSHDAEATSQSITYVKVKTITLTNGLIGQQRFLFDLKTSNVLNTANGKIYRNGVALGIEQSDVTGVYVTKSEDITQTWAPGDTVEVWVKIDNAAQIVYVQNFRIAYDDFPNVVVASVNT